MAANRRNFLKRAGALAAGAVIAPAILPSGTIFAAGSKRKVKHVVLCLVAGGMRNSETIHMQEGNLMLNTFAGKRTVSADLASSLVFPETITPVPLQQYGTLYKGFTYAKGPTGHFNAHTSVLTGMYTKKDLDIKTRPDYPTLFEYYKKHSADDTSAWWVSNMLGPYPSLGHSTDWSYGSPYAPGYLLPAEKLHTHSNDISHVLQACRVLEKNQPGLMVVNLQDADIAHSNYTSYCQNIIHADHALALLWNTIQNTPGLANDTVLIALPEHGRNAHGNSIVDANGREGLDHTGDATSRELFCLVLGPEKVIRQNEVFNENAGESIDVLPTIAELLGFYENIPAVYRKKMGQPLYSSFV